MELRIVNSFLRIKVIQIEMLVESRSNTVSCKFVDVHFEPSQADGCTRGLLGACNERLDLRGSFRFIHLLASYTKETVKIKTTVKASNN